MIVRAIIMIVMVVTCGPALAQDWTLDAEESRIAFAGEQRGGIPFAGEFGDFSAEVAFDPAQPTDARIRVSVNMRSAATDSDQRDEILHQAAWLNSAEFPEAGFVLTGLEQTGDGEYLASGTLTIRGHANEIKVPVAVEIAESAAKARGGFTIDRRDYGVGQGEWGETDRWVAYPIDVSFELVARRP